MNKWINNNPNFNLYPQTQQCLIRRTLTSCWIFTACAWNLTLHPPGTNPSAFFIMMSSYRLRHGQAERNIYLKGLCQWWGQWKSLWGKLLSCSFCVTTCSYVKQSAISVVAFYSKFKQTDRPVPTTSGTEGCQNELTSGQRCTFEELMDVSPFRMLMKDFLNQGTGFALLTALPIGMNELLFSNYS